MVYTLSMTYSLLIKLATWASIDLLLTQTLGRLWNPLVVESTHMGISVMLVSMVLIGALIVFQCYVVKRTQSNAIKADSLHYTLDFLMNFGVIIALFLASIGFHGADPYFTLSIGASVVYSA